VRFVQRKIFTGLLVTLFARKLTKHTGPGLEEMNQALKARAEQIKQKAMSTSSSLLC
jgi:hypothetical protein